MDLASVVASDGDDDDRDDGATRGSKLCSKDRRGSFGIVYRG